MVRCLSLILVWISVIFFLVMCWVILCLVYCLCFLVLMVSLMFGWKLDRLFGLCSCRGCIVVVVLVCCCVGYCF